MHVETPAKTKETVVEPKKEEVVAEKPKLDTLRQKLAEAKSKAKSICDASG